MRFFQLGQQVVIYLFLVLFNISLAKNRQLGPSTLLEALNITTNEENTKSRPSSKHGFQNRHYPSGLSCFSNCPFRQGVVFLGGPCGPMKATCCGGFGCASGIGFPISTVCCPSTSCSEANQPGEEISAAKRFDITSLPAAHPTAISVKKRPKPSKDRRKHKHKHKHPKKPKPKKPEKDSSKEGPKIDLELKLNDEPKTTEPEQQQQVVVGQPIHHRPWVPYMHRPLYPFHTHHHHHPHYFPHYMPHTMTYSHPSYWRFQGYFPHFLRRKAPWYMNPSDMKNIHRYPEYQFGDVQFTQSNHPFSFRPPFRDYNDLSSDVELLDRPEKLHEDFTHSKHKINNHKEYNVIHEQDRKMVGDSEDPKETLKPGEIKQTRADERVQGTNLGIGEDQVLNFNPTEKEDEETNYPEYKSEFNTDHFWSTAEKRQRNANIHLSFHQAEKDENAIFRDFTSKEQGFDLDDISTSHSKRKGIHKVRSDAGVVKIKSDSLGIANAITSFA